jgi:hypothetical protein
MVNRFILALRSSKAKFTGANGATEAEAVSAMVDYNNWYVPRRGGHSDSDLFVYTRARRCFNLDRSSSSKLRRVEYKASDGLKDVRMSIYVPGHYFQFRNMDQARS